MKPNLILTISLLTLMVGCRAIVATGPSPTPLPGWRSLVGELLVEDSAFPEGWARIRDLPQGMMTNPTINHVYRSWWGEAEGVGKVEQAIWRAYTIADAEDKYAELRQSQFYVHRTSSPPDFYVPFEPPDEINFQSQVADEFYLACGWRIWARCEVVARYRNYVVDMRLDLEAEYEGHATHGLTYPEIEAVVRAMDAKFAEAMGEFYPTSP
jgi:hypothetical protein